ncbi:hypothetical protein, partial [Sporofaciens musculi]|uniref:hypothetical protein n=1 Tax=Sporofaciens musculi TaxID=2681861 RepID=UPI00259D1B0C
MKKGNRRRRKNKRRAIKRLTRILVVIFLLLCLCLCLCLLLRKGNPSEEGIEYLKNGNVINLRKRTMPDIITPL